MYPERPYIWRLTVLRRLICPSTGLVRQSLTLFRDILKRLQWCSLTFASRTVLPSDQPGRVDERGSRRSTPIATLPPVIHWEDSCNLARCPLLGTWRALGCPRWSHHTPKIAHLRRASDGIIPVTNFVEIVDCSTAICLIKSRAFIYVIDKTEKYGLTANLRIWHDF